MVTYKFLNDTEFYKFVKYVSLNKCVIDFANLSISCHPSEKEMRDAIEIFNAEVIG